MPLVDEYRYAYNVENRISTTNAKRSTTRVRDEYVFVYDASRDERDAIIEYAKRIANDDATRARIDAIRANEYATNDAYIARVYYEIERRRA